PDRIALRRCVLTVIGLGDGELATVDPAGEVARHEFTADLLRVGAAEDNDLVLRDSTVSRYHCRILLDGDRFIVEDLDSTNGTFVDTVQVRVAYLRPGCALWLGKTQLRFDAIDEELPLTPSKATRFGEVLGAHPSMRLLYAILERVAPTDTTVVLEGETGTGKDVVARSVHQRSARADGPFVVFDCSAVPRNLIESELFGHERGAFTGAVGSRRGVFEIAEGGTVFLDELGELSTELQPRLLRVLEQREVKRVGSARPIKVDVRVIAATNRQLEHEVRAGRFREDLFYRLSVVRLELPPLRRRRDDVPLLVEHFLETARFNRDAKGRRLVRRVDRGALEHLMTHDWPGNVRELVNALERAVRFAEGGTIEAGHLPDHVVRPQERRVGAATAPAPAPAGDQGAGRPDGPGPDGSSPGPGSPRPPTFKDAKERWLVVFERDYVAELLRRHQGNISGAAREAALDRKYFRQLMKKHGLHPDG
ncbi:MAG TPA: sigma 54-interacting transcriptional regulator, partial [Polyangiaceae bacterium LLY-WYZ-14_1]|nr:sigma 54-interacting transcriptional regulator [Polyangiaceae bacterium LLY-WYZ-14_1]